MSFDVFQNYMHTHNRFLLKLAGAHEAFFLCTYNVMHLLGSMHIIAVQARTIT